MMNKLLTIMLVLFISAFVTISCGDDKVNPKQNNTEAPGNAGNAGNAGETGSPTVAEICSNTTAGITEISTQAGLIAIKDNLAGNYKLKNDITLTGDWEPIGSEGTPFTGNFYGCDFAIKNLTINKLGGDNIGLFAGIQGKSSTSKTIIRDLTIEVVKIDGGGSTGALAGYAVNNNIINVHIRGGKVTGTNNVGGLVGNATNNTITYSSATNEVGGTERIGGLIGQDSDNNNISKSYSTGTIEGTTSVGGLVGKAVGVISNSYATGDTTGSSKVAGLIGEGSGNLAIANSYATGKVTDNGSTDNDSAGLIGSSNTSITISNSYFDITTTEQSIASPTPSLSGTHSYSTKGVVKIEEPAGSGTWVAITKKHFKASVEKGDTTDWVFNDDFWYWEGDGKWPTLRLNPPPTQ